jgi:hypothetical protein
MRPHATKDGRKFADIREAARELRGDKRVASDAAFGTHAPAAHDGGSKNGGTSIETGSHGSKGVKHDADTKQDGGTKHETQGKVEGGKHDTQGKAEGSKQISDTAKHEVDAKHDTSIKQEANQQNHADTTKGGSAAVGSHGDTGVRTESGMWTMNWRGMPPEEMVCVKLREALSIVMAPPAVALLALAAQSFRRATGGRCWPPGGVVYSLRAVCAP